MTLQCSCPREGSEVLYQKSAGPGLAFDSVGQARAAPNAMVRGTTHRLGDLAGNAQTVLQRAAVRLQTYSALVVPYVNPIARTLFLQLFPML
jgi:hypothetical protein